MKMAFPTSRPVARKKRSISHCTATRCGATTGEACTVQLPLIGSKEDPNWGVSPRVMGEAREAVAWTREHPNLWGEMCDRAAVYAETGAHCSVRDDIVLPTMRKARDRVRHSMTAAFARLLCMEVDGFERCITMQRSCFDVVEWEGIDD